MELQRQIRSTFVTAFWFCKTEIQDRAGILVLVSLVSYDFQNLLTILAQFLKFKSSSNFYPIFHTIIMICKQNRLIMGGGRNIHFQIVSFGQV